MIRKIGQAFVLDTAHTTYAFSILPGGHPEHLYYGRTIHIEHPDDLEILVEKHVFAPGNVNICEKEHAGFSLEDVRLEMSSYGKGDIREPFVEAILYDGAKTLDFRYEDAVITGKKMRWTDFRVPMEVREKSNSFRSYCRSTIVTHSCCTSPALP